MNIAELREAIRESISTLVQERKIIWNMKQADKPEFRARLDVIEKTILTLEDFCNELPERGTVIIDSKGLTVVPFEIKDKVYKIGRLSSCPDRWAYYDSIKIQSIEYQSGEVWFFGGLHKLEWSKDCFATREEAEAECQRRAERKK